jgi:hypothetical protein
MRACKNCGWRPCVEVGLRLRRGLCPQCFDALELVLTKVLNDSERHRRRIALIGDEAAIAFANGMRFVMRELRPYTTRTTKKRKAG